MDFQQKDFQQHNYAKSSQVGNEFIQNFYNVGMQNIIKLEKGQSRCGRYIQRFEGLQIKYNKNKKEQRKKKLLKEQFNSLKSIDLNQIVNNKKRESIQSVLTNTEEKDKNTTNTTIHKLLQDKNKKLLLDNISFEIPSSKVTAIISRDDSDKYLMKFLSLQKRKNNYSASYDISFDNQQVQNIHHYQRLTSTINEKKYLDKYKTPYQTFEFYAKVTGLENPKQIAEEVIELIGIQGCAQTKIQDISKCEYKRCQIGAEIIRKPSILYISNAFDNLNRYEKQDLLKILNKLSRRGMTIILQIKDENDLLIKYYNYLIILYDKKKYFEGTISQLHDQLYYEQDQYQRRYNYITKFYDIIDYNIFKIKFENLKEKKQEQLKYYQTKLKILNQIEQDHIKKTQSNDNSFNDQNLNQNSLKKRENELKQRKYQINIFNQI